MKKLFVLVFALTIGAAQAQSKVSPTFEKEGNLVKATYYYDDGTVHQQGFFKDNKLTGMWTKFDKKGNKIAIGFYKEGKKTGKWFHWNRNQLKEVTYKNSAIEKVSIWTDATTVASNK